MSPNRMSDKKEWRLQIYRDSDPEFPPQAQLYIHLLSLMREIQKLIWPLQWLRPHDLRDYETPVGPWELYTMSRVPGVYRGSIMGVCLIGALNAILLCNPDNFFTNNFVNSWYTKQGCYGLHICLNGKWTTVAIDDKLPCNGNRRPVASMRWSIRCVDALQSGQRLRKKTPTEN